MKRALLFCATFGLQLTTASAQANRTLDSLRSLLPAHRNEPAFLNTLAKEHGKKSPDSVLFYAATALSLSQKSGNKTDIAESYNRLGLYQSLMGNVDSAIALFQASCSYAASAGNYLISAASYMNLGFAYLIAGETKEAGNALFAAQENLEKAPAGRSRDELATKVYMYLAEFYNMLGLLDKAAEAAYTGLTIANRIQDTRMQGLLYNAIGNTNNLLKDWQKAANCYNLAIEKSIRIEDAVNTQKYFSNAASCYAQIGKYDSAKLYLGISLNRLHQLGTNPVAEAFIYREMGKLALFQEQYDSARQYLLRAMETYKNAGVSDRQADCIYWLGNIEQEQGHIPAAINLYQSALHIYTDAGETEQTKDILRDLSELEAARNNYKAAWEYQQQYSTVLDTLFSTEKASAITAHEIRYETALKEKQIREQQLQLRYQQQRNQWLIAGGSTAFLAAIALGVLYHRTQQQKRKIRKQAQHISLLNEDIIHSNKNNLLLLKSIFERQAEDKGYHANAIVNKERVATLSLLLSQLYEQPEQKNTSLLQFLQKLCKSKETAFGILVTLQYECQDIALPPRILQYIGLIINELTTNAAKHAFVSVAEPPVISVHVRLPNPQVLLLHVRDNGQGLPDGFHIEGNADSKGMGFVNDFVRPCGGTIRAYNKDGACFDITLPIQL